MFRKPIDSLSLGTGIVVALLVFFPLALSLHGDDLYEIINLLIMSVSLGTAVAIHPAAYNALRLPLHAIKAGEIMAVALTILAVAAFFVFGGQYFWRMLGRPDYLIESTALAFTRWVFFVAMVLALISSGAERNELPLSTYQRAGVYIAIGTLLAGLMLTFGFS